MHTTAIIPVYNEEEVVGEIIMRTLRFVDEVIVIDDGSTDRTPYIVDEVSRIDKRVRVLHVRPNRGKGNAIRIGLREARGEIIVIQDADGEYPPEQIPNIVEPIKRGKADVIFGSRFMGSCSGMHYTHLIANYTLSLAASIFLMQRVTDVMTGAKAWLNSHHLAPRPSGFMVEADLTAMLICNSRRFIEVPYYYMRRRIGEAKIKPLDFFKSLFWIIISTLYWRQSAKKLRRGVRSL